MRNFLFAFFLLLSFSSYTGAAETTLLREDFTNGPGAWQAAFACGLGCQGYQESVVVNNGIASVTSIYPHLFWVDRNHGDPGGLGDLAMLLSVCLTKALINGKPCMSGLPALDLRDAKLRVRLRVTCCEGTYPYGGLAYAGPGSDSKARIVWWFDTMGPEGKFVNMAAIGKPLDNLLSDGQWHEIEIAPQRNDWACLGSINSQATFYGCAPAHQVLGNVTVATGLLLFPIDRDNIPLGKIEIDYVWIVRP